VSICACRVATRPPRETTATHASGPLQRSGATCGERVGPIAAQLRSHANADHRCGEHNLSTFVTDLLRLCLGDSVAMATAVLRLSMSYGNRHSLSGCLEVADTDLETHNTL
jgi:hypothetical protein